MNPRKMEPERVPSNGNEPQRWRLELSLYAELDFGDVSLPCLADRLTASALREYVKLDFAGWGG